MPDVILYLEERCAHAQESMGASSSRLFALFQESRALFARTRKREGKMTGGFFTGCVGLFFFVVISGLLP